MLGHHQKSAVSNNEKSYQEVCSPTPVGNSDALAARHGRVTRACNFPSIKILAARGNITGPERPALLTGG